MDELLVELEIPLYIREYIKSNSIRAKFYQEGKKEIPLKYCIKGTIAGDKRVPDGINYEWRNHKVLRKGKPIFIRFLTEIASGKRIIANEWHVGKENKANINGQSIYNGDIARHDRNNLMGQIKDMFRKHIRTIQPINRFPLRITIYIFDTILDDEYSNGQDWDLDNRFFPYGKAFADTLKHEGKIPDDNRYYITEPPHAIFVPVDDTQDRRLLIRIYKDNRKVILNNFLFQKKHGSNLL